MPNTAFFVGASTGGGTVGGLIGQWQSDVGVTVSGSEVTAITDQSGAGNHLAKVSTTGPSLVSSVLNGYDGIRHSPSGGPYTLRKTSANGFTSAADLTLVAVHSPYNSGTALVGDLYDVINGIAELAIGNGGASFASATDYRLGGFYAGAFRATNAVWRGNSVVNTFDIVMITRASGTNTVYKNGAALTPTASSSDGTASTPIIGIGAAWNDGGGVGGTWTQVRLYDHALDATERAAVFSALGTKYNIPILTSSGTALNRAGWTVTASRHFSTRPESRAIDGNATTEWTTGGSISVGSDYFQIDLGSAQTVGGVQVDNASPWGDTPTSGDIQYSDNGSSWTTITSWTVGVGTTATIAASWTPVSHRYWRLLAQGTATGGAGNWWTIFEINLYSDAAP